MNVDEAILQYQYDLQEQRRLEQELRVNRQRLNIDFWAAVEALRDSSDR
jgi:hypothetical protein